MAAGRETSASGTRLRGGALVAVRLVWAAIAIFYVASFLISLPPTLSGQKGFAQQSLGWPEADTKAALDQLGISYESFLNYDTWGNLAITLVFFGLGAFIFWRRSDDWMAVLFSLLFLTFPGTAIFGTLGQLHPAWNTVQLVTSSLSSMNIVALFIFPDGRFVPRWIRWVALGFAAIQVWRIFQPDQYAKISLPSILPVLLCVLLSQIYRYRWASTPVQRQQTKWVVFGWAVGFTPLLVYLFAFLGNPTFSKPGAAAMAIFLLGNALWTFSLVSLVVSITVAILRSRLWDIDVIIRRTLVYAALIATLSLVYFGCVLVLQGLFQIIAGRSQSPAVTVISTLAIAALFAPLQRRIRAGVDQRFYRKQYDAQKTLEGFAAQARSQVELEQLTSHLLAVVQETMQPEHASLWLKAKPGEGERARPGAGG